MQNPDCLNAAMFLAAESYSGSSYEDSLFNPMDEICEDATAIATETEMTIIKMAA